MKTIAFLALNLVSTIAFAHPGHDHSGLVGGFFHHLLDANHLAIATIAGVLAVFASRFFYRA